MVAKMFRKVFGATQPLVFILYYLIFQIGTTIYLYPRRFRIIAVIAVLFNIVL